MLRARLSPMLLMVLARAVSPSGVLLSQTYSVSVTPDGGSVNAPANTSGLTVDFTVRNTGAAAYIDISCSILAPVASCSDPHPDPVWFENGDLLPVTVTYSTGSSGGNGRVTLRGTVLDGPMDTGYYTVVVAPPPPAVSVTPDGSTTPDREANTGGYSESFKVKNTGGSSGTFNFSCVDSTAPVTCTWLSASSATLGAGDSTFVTASYDVAAADTGNLKLDATGSATDFGYYRVPVHYYGVAVTPHGGTTPARLTNTPGYSARFSVRNSGTSTITYSISCSGVNGVTCTGREPVSLQLGPNQSDSVTAYYDVAGVGTGTLTLTATSTSGPPRSDDGSFNVPIVLFIAAPSNWDVSPFNNDYQILGRCAAACFAVTHAQSTVPYFSLDTPRNLTLVYQGDRLHPRPFIHLNVQKPDAQVPLEVWLQVKPQGGAFYTFANGETLLKFVAASSGFQRIGGQLRDSTMATGMYSIEIVVTWYYGGSTTAQSWPTRLMVVNETDAPVARGWTIAGVQRLYPQASGHVLITEGDGSAVFFGASGGTFVAPQGEFSALETYLGGWRRRYPDSTKVVFSSAGLMTDVYDRFNGRTQFFYDGSNRLYTVRDPNGQDLVLAYNSNGLASIRDNVGIWRYTNVTVLLDRRLTAIQDPDLASTQFGYDGSQRLQSITDRKGNTTTLDYQVINNVVTGKLASVTAPQITVFENGQVQGAVPVTLFAPWQTVGVPYVLTASSPAAVVLPSAVYGRVIEPGNKTTKFTADRWGQPVTTVDTLGHTTTVTYESSGLPAKVQHPTGAVDSTAYNANGLPVYLKPSGLSATEVRYHGTWKAQPDSVWGSARPIHRFWLGTGGRVDSSTVGGTNKTRYTYDSFGRVTQVTDANGTWVQSRDYLGINGNLSAVNSPQRSYRYGHDGYGRVTSDSVVSIGKRTFEYDILNRQRKVWDGENANPTESIYDNLYLIKVIDPKLQDYEYGYNALGWNIWVEDPVGARDSLWYNRDGDLTRSKNRRAEHVRFYYDALHRLVAKGGTNTDSSNFAYSTGPGINWSKASNPYDTTTTNLNNDGLVTSVQTVFGGRTYTINALYTAAGWVDSVWATGSAGSFMGRRYVWGNGTGTLSDLRLSGKGAAISYDIKLRAQSTTFTGAVVTTRDFITTNENARVQPNQSQLADLGRRLEFGFGRIRSHFETGGAADVGNFFGYDKLDRLKADTTAIVTYDNCTWNPGAGWQCPPPIADSVHVYSYDGASNRLDLGGTYNTGNRITNFDGCSYGSDSTGNVTSRTCGGQTVRFHWTAENLLKAVKVVGGDSLDFRYDATGRLVRRDVNSSVQAYFLWSGDHLFAELDPNGVDRVEYSYYPGMDRLHAVSAASDTVYFAHQDGLGNTIGLVNHHNNQLRGTYWYDRWGKWVTENENLGTGARNRSRFKGALWMGDQGPELYYMRNRWYELQSGRFLSEDPIGLAGGINQYVFAANDPVGRRDPTGLTTYCRYGGYDVFDGAGNYLGQEITWADCWEEGGDDNDDDTGTGCPNCPPRRLPVHNVCRVTEFEAGVSGSLGAVIFGGGGVTVGFNTAGQVFMRFRAAGHLGFGAIATVGGTFGGSRTTPLRPGLSTQGTLQMTSQVAVGAFAAGITGSLAANSPYGGGGVSVTSPRPSVGVGLGIQNSFGVEGATTLASRSIFRRPCR